MGIPGVGMFSKGPVGKGPAAPAEVSPKNFAAKPQTSKPQGGDSPEDMHGNHLPEKEGGDGGGGGGGFMNGLFALSAVAPMVQDALPKHDQPPGGDPSKGGGPGDPPLTPEDKVAQMQSGPTSTMIGGMNTIAGNM
jgi:hypothetical protein